MLEFIIHYWLEVVFGLVVTGLGLAIGKLWKLYKTERDKDIRAEINGLLEDMNGKDDELRAEIARAHAASLEHDDTILAKIDSLTQYIETLKGGVLSIQGSHFRKKCLEYLKEDKEITLDEFDQLEKDHIIYNSLGGNHRGDELFKLVQIKVQAQLAK